MNSSLNPSPKTAGNQLSVSKTENMTAKVKKWIKRSVISVERHAEQEKEVIYWYFKAKKLHVMN